MRLKILLLFTLIHVSSFGQDTTTQKLPPIEMLTKNGAVVTETYELPHKTEYKIYNQNGQLIESGFGQFIDYTEFEHGTYFIKFDGQTILIEKNSNDYQNNSLVYILSFILLLSIILLLFFRKRVRDIKKEQQNLLNEIRALKKAAKSKTDTPNFSDNITLDKTKIEKLIDGKLNQSDWKIIEELVKQPSISNKNLASQVSLSVEGTRSSLRKMYRIFNIPSSRNMRLTLVLKLIKISNETVINDN